MPDRCSFHLSPSLHLAGISGISLSGAALPSPSVYHSGSDELSVTLHTHPSPCSSVRVALEGGGGVYLGCLGLVLRVCRWSLWDPVKFLSNPGKKDLETKEEMCADTTLLNHDTQNGNQAGLARCRTVVPVDTGQSGTEHGPHPSNYNLGF